jgi:uncharacterized membrane protein
VSTTKAGICFAIAAIILALAFLLGWAGEPFAAWHPRVLTLALFFVSLGLLLTQ